MANRRTILNADVAIVIEIIGSFRKRPTWDAIAARAQKTGLPFQKRALQGNERIKAAYDNKLDAVRKRRDISAEKRAKVGLPSSASHLADLVLRYQQRIEELEAELKQRNVELSFMTQRCRRENIELSEIKRPFKKQARD